MKNSSDQQQIELELQERAYSSTIQRRSSSSAIRIEPPPSKPLLTPITGSSQQSQIRLTEEDEQSNLIRVATLNAAAKDGYSSCTSPLPTRQGVFGKSKSSITMQSDATTNATPVRRKASRNAVMPEQRQQLRPSDTLNERDPFVLMKQKSGTSSNDNLDSEDRIVRPQLARSPSKAAGDMKSNSAATSNKIRTAMYTRFTFLPVSFMLQFTKLGNAYWALSVLLQFYKPIQTANPFMVLLIIMVVVFVGVWKEWWSDSKRQKADRQVNNKKFQRVSSLIASKQIKAPTSEEEEELQRDLQIDNTKDVASQDILLGDILWLQEDQIIPADCLLLQTAYADGSAMISTGQLDGERVLKPKYAISATQTELERLMEITPRFSEVEAEKVVGRRGFQVRCSVPTPNLFFFDGRAEMLQKDGSTSLQQLSIDQFLPRGSILRNASKGVLALAIYIGADTKLIQNQGKDLKYKKSNSEKTLNKIFMIQAISVIIISVVLGLLGYSFLIENEEKMPYIFENLSSIERRPIIIIMTFWLLLVRFLPLDVILLSETGKMVYSKYMELDARMMTVDPQTGEIISCKVQSMQLPEQLGEIDHIFSDKTGTLTQNELLFRAISVDGVVCEGLETDKILDKVKKTQSSLIEPLFRCFCLCNDVSFVKDPVTLANKPQCSSQDELLLLDVATQSDICTLIDRSQTKFFLQEKDRVEEYTLIRHIQFSSERRMMTMVVRDKAGDIYVFSKGADSAIMPLIADQGSTLASIDNVEQFGEQGMRTLAFAYKRLDSRHQQPGEELDLSELEDSFFESNLVLLGATGVEDKLQEDVHKCITDFQEAGVRTWIVTGDKNSTAKCIGFTSGVFSAERPIVAIDEATNDSIKALKSLQEGKSDLLISGKAVNQLIRDGNAEQKATVDNLLMVKGLVVYRASPAEKAELVKVVRACRPEITTLAIGDGANDVNMIQQAHVGVGIIGKEGTQASSYSDFAIGRFKDLRRLMFWHGNNFGFSLTDFCNLMMSKTMIVGTVAIFYNIHAGFSGGYFIQDFLWAFYNLSSYGFYCLFEVNVSKRYFQDCEGKLNFKMSECYAHYRDHHMKGMLKRFLIFSFFMYWGGAVCYYVPTAALAATIGPQGQVQSLYTVGLAMYISLVIFTNVLIDTNVKDYNVAITIVSFMIALQIPLTFYIVNQLSFEALYKDVPEILSNSQFYLTVLLTVFLLMLPFMIYRRVTQLLLNDQVF